MLESINESIFVSRFLTISWYFLFPAIFSIIFFFMRKTYEDGKVLVINPLIKPFKRYSYFYHNLLFIFFITAFSFNGCLFIYFFVDTHLVAFLKIQELLWNDSNKYRFFWGIVFSGCLFHLFIFCVYIFHNLYRTDSYFANLWKEYIDSKVLQKKLRFMKDKFPELYLRIDRFFFQINTDRHREPQIIILQ